MAEQWPWTKAVYTVQTQLWAAAHWLILQCVWERRGTPFSSFVLVSVNSVVGGRAHCGGQCFVLTQGLAQLVPRVQPEDSWIMERGSSGPRGSSQSLTGLVITLNYSFMCRQVKLRSRLIVLSVNFAATLCSLTLWESGRGVVLNEKGTKYLNNTYFQIMYVFFTSPSYILMYSLLLSLNCLFYSG